MQISAARRLHLGLFGVGALLYAVFVLPRWWVLTGDIPRTLAGAGRITAGIVTALAAWPVMRILQTGLRTDPRPPELALRLRAWSGLSHLAAGGLILLAAIAEIWVRLQAGAPWLFGVYGAAAALAALGAFALYLSFVAEQPPAAPKPPKTKKPKSSSGDATKPTTRLGRKRAGAQPADDTTSAEDTGGVEETVVVETDDAADEPPMNESQPELVVTEPDMAPVGQVTLRNTRPAGKSRRLSRK